jgi:hypothetical protein
MRKKLKLNTETVRLLSDEALRFAVGGTTSETANPFCTNGTCASVGCTPHTAGYLSCGCHKEIE